MRRAPHPGVQQLLQHGGLRHGPAVVRWHSRGANAGVLENFDLAAANPVPTLINAEGGKPSVLGVHLVSQAKRLAYADRKKYVADTDFVSLPGNGVVMTTTIESGMGSFHFTRGFLLDNQLTDFSFEPSDATGPIANRVTALKRPRSSMAPTLVFNATADSSLGD